MPPIHKLDTIVEGSHESLSPDSPIFKTANPNLLMEFLYKCKPGASGSFVNQGTYGIGLTYEIKDPYVSSPLSFLPLSAILTRTLMNNGHVFVKFVPLTEPMPREEFESEKSNIRLPIEIKYIDGDGDITSGYLRTSSTKEQLSPNTLHVGFGRQTIKYDDFMGFNWSILGNTNQNKIQSTYIRQFLDECESQIKIFKKTNNDLDSCIIPIYETLVVSNKNIHIIEELEKNYNFKGTNPLSPTFFTEIKKHLRISNYFKMGLIVMPMMPIPPVTLGWHRFYSLKCYKNYDELNISNIATKQGNDYILYDYDDTSIDWWKRQALFLFTQIVCYMITLLEHDMIHGDVHPGNVLIHPDLPNTTQCFHDSRPDKSRYKQFFSKVFLLDFGTVTTPEYRVSNELILSSRFAEQIKQLLTTQGTHGFSPIESSVYDWLPALFLRRNSNGEYLVKAERKTISEIRKLPDDKYFISENFDKMFDMMNKFRLGNAEFRTHTLTKLSVDPGFNDFLRKIRAFNKSGDISSTVRGGNKKLHKHMDKMIANLRHGEESLKLLQREYKAASPVKRVSHVSNKKKQSKTLRKSSRSKTSKTRGHTKSRRIHSRTALRT
jgi:hypothetical protein